MIRRDPRNALDGIIKRFRASMDILAGIERGCVGSSFDDFLRENGLGELCEVNSEQDGETPQK